MASLLIIFGTILTLYIMSQRLGFVPTPPLVATLNQIDLNYSRCYKWTSHMQENEIEIRPMKRMNGIKLALLIPYHMCLL